MNRFQLDRLHSWGSVSFLAGAAMLVCFAWMSRLPSLRGPAVTSFLAAFLLASLAYAIAALRLKRDHLPLVLIWVFAIMFRLIMLSTSPTLSDDVFRNIWDGHLLNQGVNPYAFPVESPLLDQYNTPLRGLINNSWMASPYLPSAQLLFAAVGRLVPQSTLVFQAAAIVFDLSTGLLVMNILKMLNLPRGRVLIYLWNPLIVIEFSHSAHIDALMLFLIMLSFWFLVRARPDKSNQGNYRTASAVSLAAATLTKALPGLLAPLFIRRWGWWRMILYGILIAGALALFALSAGWGISGPLDGRGVFGALRIFTQYWNYNSSIYHWLEVLVTGYSTPGAVPLEVAGEGTINLLRKLLAVITGLVAIGVGLWAWFLDDPDKRDHVQRSLYLLRLALIPLGAYLLLTHTVHPWYVTLVLPFIPFLLPRKGEEPLTARFAVPWLYLSCAVAFSYLTYLDPDDLREFYLVRWLEYIPFYILLIWAAWPYLSQGLTSILERDTR